MLELIMLSTLVLFTALIAHSYALRLLTTYMPGPFPTVPYTLPWIGSFFSFNRDPLRFFQDCHQLYGYIYKVFLAGRTIVIVTHPDGIASITRDTTKYLTHKDIFIHMLRGITGFSGDVNLIHDLLDSKIFPITKLTLSPSSMQDVTASFDRLLLRQLRSLKSVNDRTRTIKLSDLIGRPLYIAGCYALFGSTFPLQTFCDFQKLDSDLPQLLTQLPFVGRRGAQARERLLSSIIGYIQPWWDSDIVEDLPEASATVMQSLAELKASQVTIREAAGTLLLLLWGFHSNTWYMLFWLMTHLVADESAMSCLLTDIGISELGHVPKDSEHNIHHPLLDSAILEILRWATTSTTVRYAEEDTQITVDGNNVPINKGEYVMGDVRAVHHDFSTFKDPDQFKIDRYLSEGGTAHSLPKPMAWGGGKHMCVGRHVATHVMRRYMLDCLYMYDIKSPNQACNAKRLPRISSRHFIGSLKTSEDVWVIISNRSNLLDCVEERTSG